MPGPDVLMKAALWEWEGPPLPPHAPEPSTSVPPSVCDRGTEGGGTETRNEAVRVWGEACSFRSKAALVAHA